MARSYMHLIVVMISVVILFSNISNVGATTHDIELRAISELPLGPTNEDYDKVVKEYAIPKITREVFVVADSAVSDGSSFTVQGSVTNIDIPYNGIPDSILVEITTDNKLKLLASQKTDLHVNGKYYAYFTAEYSKDLDRAQKLYAHVTFDNSVSNFATFYYNQNLSPETLSMILLIATPFLIIGVIVFGIIVYKQKKRRKRLSNLKESKLK